MSSKFNFEKYNETLENKEKKEVDVMENKDVAEVKKTTRKTITKEEMEEINNNLLENIKKELDFMQYRLYKGLHKENVERTEILMERITELEEKIKAEVK